MPGRRDLRKRYGHTCYEKTDGMEGCKCCGSSLEARMQTYDVRARVRAVGATSSSSNGV